jgi:hypothetical protein
MVRAPPGTPISRANLCPLERSLRAVDLASALPDVHDLDVPVALLLRCRR